MSISIINNHPFFENKKNAILIFKDLSKNNNFTIKKEGDFTFILSKDDEIILGINIFNFEKYFYIEEGFHSINDEVKEYFLNNYGKYLRKEDFDDLFKIGKIVKIDEHPETDKLKVLQVNFDNNIKLQIITNVKEVKINENYLFALPGAITFQGKKILASKILNVESNGMIVSYKSLGIDKEGIIECSNLSINDKFKF